VGEHVVRNLLPTTSRPPRRRRESSGDLLAVGGMSWRG
jgi:hypothetical protein